MPRPKKCRKVCCLPDNDGFVPVRGGEELTPIVLNVDEYESCLLYTSKSKLSRPPTSIRHMGTGAIRVPGGVFRIGLTIML